jgi:hypothetical protein
MFAVLAMPCFVSFEGLLCVQRRGLLCKWRPPERPAERAVGPVIPFLDSASITDSEV